MKLPNAHVARIDPSKLCDYVLNVEHKRGGSKAQLLALFGYTPINWQDLEVEIRRHLGEDVNVFRKSDYGDRYEVRMQIDTPVGRPLFIRTIWQIDVGTAYPRLITLFPD